MKIFLVLFLFCFTGFLFAQQTVSKGSSYFTANSNQKFGFDDFEGFWEGKYHYFKNEIGEIVFYAHKSIAENEYDLVNFVLKIKNKVDQNQLSFENKDLKLKFVRINDTLFSLTLPKSSKDFIVKAKYKEKVLAKLKVAVFKHRLQKIIVIPLIHEAFNDITLEKEINEIFKVVNFQVDLEFKAHFKSKVFNDTTIFSNPDLDQRRYTGQMRLLRDLYFSTYPNSDKKAKYIFLIKGFRDSSLNEFMVRSKSFGLVSIPKDKKKFSRSLAKALSFGIAHLKDSWQDNGPEINTSQNLMDVGDGRHMTFFQWENFQSIHSVNSFFDNDEFVRTNNGTVAYFFWEEDSLGNIICKKGDYLSAIKKPYKKNYLSYRFNVKYSILKPFYKFGNYFITIINLILILIIVLLFLFSRKKLKGFWAKKSYKRKYLRRILYLPLIFGFGYLTVLSFELSNMVLDHFIVVSGPIPELGNSDYTKAKMTLLTNNQLRHKEELGLYAEILVKKNKEWTVRKRKPVLYFEYNLANKTIRYVNNSDSLILPQLNYRNKVFSHYFVISFKDSTKQIVKQEIYNHFGDNITAKINVEDVSKRILLFVNGYRPTSLGRTFEENFDDIKSKGLEFQNSKNVIYDFDRYDYWEQWNQINLLFQNRLNANKTYYADGHFSVSTSDYRSLLNFSSFSTNYPKRCPNLKHHTCYKWGNLSFKDRLLNETQTISQLKRRPNHKGFQLRRNKGRIAGRNLLQVLNDIPNRSENDTLFIVAHSMGFAYSLGVIDELRGKINFGGFYIIAAENARSGKINQREWKEVWQYGINLEPKNFDAPCLQDGVAPQSKVGGLSKNNRVFFPNELFQKKGFFNSHFIGNYTWVLNIPQGEKGSVKQH